MKMPFLQAVREAWPDAKVSWVHGSVPSQFAGILAPLAEGLIDEIISDADLGEGLGAMMPWSRTLPGRHFDLVIDTQKNPRRTFVLKRLSHDRLISPTWRFFFSDGRPPKELKKPRALVDKLLAMAAAASGRVLRPNHIISVPDVAHQAAGSVLPESGTLVAFAPGAGLTVTGKCWPLDRFIEAARDQESKGRTPVFPLGPQERDLIPTLRDALPNAIIPLPENVPASIGLSQFDEKGPMLLLAMAGRFAASVANCSGAGHILAAGGSPMVSLFGPTNPDKFAPYTPNLTVLRARNYGGDAIEQIPLDAVTEAIDVMIETTENEKKNL